MNKYIFPPIFVGSPKNCLDHPGIRFAEEPLVTYVCLGVKKICLLLIPFDTYPWYKIQTIYFPYQRFHKISI
jgi:hypothetical protein